MLSTRATSAAVVEPVSPVPIAGAAGTKRKRGPGARRKGATSASVFTLTPVPLASALRPDLAGLLTRVSASVGSCSSGYHHISPCFSYNFLFLSSPAFYVSTTYRPASWCELSFATRIGCVHKLRCFTLALRRGGTHLARGHTSREGREPTREQVHNTHP